MEKEKYTPTVEQELEQEFGTVVAAKIRRVGTFEGHMKHLESLLVEARVELTEDQKIKLRQFLIENGRAVGWPSESKS